MIKAEDVIREVSKYLEYYKHYNRSAEMSYPKTKTFKRNLPKVGRNTQCPCGSGKKYKFCCEKGNK